MRAVKFTISIILIIIISSFNVYAEDMYSSDDMISDYTSQLFESLDDDSKKILSKFGFENIKTESIYSLSFGSVLSAIKESFSLSIKESLSGFFRMTALIILIIILNSLRGNNDNEIINDVFSLVLILIISVQLTDIITLFSSVINVTLKFTVSLLPIVTALLSLSGNITFSAAYSTMMIGFCEVLTYICDSIIVPFSGVYFALIIAMSFNEITDSERISSSVTGALSSVLGFVCTLFTLLLSAKNILSKDIDGVLYKSGKYLLSSSVPVIGGALSSALSSVIGSIDIVKSTVGIFAVIAAVCINMPLLIKISVCRLSFGVLSMIADSFGEKKSASLIRGVSKSLKLISVLSLFMLFIVIISTGLAVSVKGNV